jgi:hypothetical protein
MPLGPGVVTSVASGSTKDQTPSESAQPPTGKVTTRTTVTTARESHSFPPLNSCPSIATARMSALSNTLERQCRIRTSKSNPRAGS